MQNYKEINGNDYVKDSRTTINETMRSIQSMNSGTAFPTTNLFEGMKCYRTDLKKTYTLTDVENNTWVEDAHAELADEATHAASATKLQTPRALNLSGAVTADAASFDGTADATINVKTLDASKLKGTASVSTMGNAATATKLATARTIALSGNATGSTTFDGSGNATINATVNESAHAATADKATADKYGADIADNYVRKYVNVGEQDLNNFRYGGLYANPANANATTARHYPANEAGSLLVMNNGANGVDGCSQIYTTYSSHDSYKREYDAEAKIWSGWRKYAFEDSTVARALVANNLNSGADTGSITINQSGYSDYSPTVGGNYANMNISSWFGVSFTSQCGGSVPKGKTAVGIDCREGIVRARSFEGYLNGNSATATKLQTPRTISLTGNASGSATFDGSGNVSINTNVSMADTVDGYHESSFLRYRGDAAANGENTLWSQIGIKRYEGKLPKGVSGTYNYGGVVSLPADAGARLDIWYNHMCSTNGDGLWYRSGYSNDEKAWARLLDSVNYTKYAPTKTGSGASGTWPISISGTATNADKLDGYHASDIINRITAANTGGIVAASLTENGYVKFANGLILQWGKLVGLDSDDWEWITTRFPIAFTSACLSVQCCSENVILYAECAVKNFQKTSVDIGFHGNYRRNVRWMAIGV